MRKSVLFQRVFTVAMVALLMTTVLTTLMYTVIARSLFTGIKEAELMPKARALGNLVLSYRNGELSADELSRLIESSGVDDSVLLGGYAVIVNADGRVLLRSGAMDDEQIENLKATFTRVLSGEEVTISGTLSVGRISMFGVGVPVTADDVTVGAVLLFVPLYEAMAAVSSMSSALFMSLMVVVPIVAAIVYVVAGRIAQPLRQMRDVATAMAAGNFKARADDTQRGEIGQLGASLNHLSRELSSTIEALILERNRLMQSVDGLSEGFVSVNSMGTITHHNPAVVRLLQSAARMNEDDARLKLIPDAGLWRDFDRAIADNQPISRDLQLPDRVLRATIAPLVGEGGLNAGAVCLLRDITESERLESTRREYVANVSHELRSPLTAMRALIEPLRDGMVQSEEARVRYYNIILRETMRLSRLINDLMELSRLQSGTLALNVQSMSLRGLIEDLNEKYRAAAEEHGLSFLLSFDPEDCPLVIANADRVEQVMVILLDNAMKYTPEGGEIALNARWDERRVTLSVKDSGVGIAPADQPYVFDRFYKVDKAHSGLGSGLGLSIAREILQRMGEEIWLSSGPGGGSEFFFTLKRQ